MYLVSHDTDRSLLSARSLYVTDFLLSLMMWIIGYGEPSNVDHIGRSTKGSWVEIPNDVSNRFRSSRR